MGIEVKLVGLGNVLLVKCWITVTSGIKKLKR